MQMHLYDTATRQERLFEPLDPQLVRIYSCWPTVYGRQHIGNLRYAFYVDLLKVALREVWWYQIKHVMNITDVGHLTDDGDQGQDKMEKGAAKEWLSAWDVAKKYEEIYLQDLSILGIEAFDVMPRATEHIAEQIAMVVELERKWLTYILPEDGVYLDSSKIDDYGSLLSEKHLEWIVQGQRVEHDGKKNPTDFALWKFSPRDEQRQMERESPWGVGFPGWHIECSAMSLKHLGPQIDIHTGGVEHIPVHHTNEIVQSEHSFCSHPWVQFWFHLQHLQLQGTKISKSLGNVVYLSDMLDRGYSPEDVRYFFLSAHYRSFQDFTWEQLTAAKNTRTNIIKKIAAHDLSTYTTAHSWGDLYEQLQQAFADDLDTVKALALINAGLQWSAHDIYDILLFDAEVLRLGLFAWVEKLAQQQAVVAPQEIQDLAVQRQEAKNNKQYEQADILRGQIHAAGWQVTDAADGFVLSPLE